MKPFEPFRLNVDPNHFNPPLEPDPHSLVHRAVIEIGKDKAMAIEQHIKLRIKPAPRFISEKLWQRIAAKFLLMEFHPETIINE